MKEGIKISHNGSQVITGHNVDKGTHKGTKITRGTDLRTGK